MIRAKVARVMANTSLTPELAKLVGELAAAFANSQKVVAAKARIGLFYQNPEATDLFRKVSEYGETLRNKHMEGMPPSEEELERRLRGRGDTPEDQILIRMERAKWEMDQRVWYDHVLVNDDADVCAGEILKIIADEA